MPPKRGRGRGRGRPRKDAAPAADSDPAAAEENGENGSNEEIPQPHDSAQENGEGNPNAEMLQSFDEENGAAEVSKPSKRRRKDPVADPSSIGFSGSGQLRQRRNVPAVQEQKKRKIDNNSNMCHQCQRNDNGRVVRCQGCIKRDKKIRYCVKCIKRWYPHMSEDDFATNCPVCRKNCNCKACLRGDISTVGSRNVKSQRKINIGSGARLMRDLGWRNKDASTARKIGRWKIRRHRQQRGSVDERSGSIDSKQDRLMKG